MLQGCVWRCARNNFTSKGIKHYERNVCSKHFQYCLNRLLIHIIFTNFFLNQERFDYIFYTGGTSVGKIVRQAANVHLTPCTLELGGKSPVYIDENCNLETAVKRLLWGKVLNLGQTCIAPDYILATKKVESKVVELVPKFLKEWFGDNPQESPDLCRIVNERHFNRLKRLLDTTTGNVATGK